MNARNGHAVVIGSSMAGLLAARVLSDYFARVTLVERDQPSDTPTTRKGVPQGRHVHVLLKAGSDVIDGLFPGLWDEMRAHGSRPVDLGAGIAWFHYGIWKSRAPAGIHMYCQSRPMLEWHLRKWVLERPGIELLSGVTVRELIHDDTQGRVTGVRVDSSKSRTDATQIDADLVVDGSGRGTRTPAWLANLGYTAPEENSVAMNVNYASLQMRLPVDHRRDWTCLMIYPKPPGQTRFGYVFPKEDGVHLVTLAGCLGDAPPLDQAGFEAFARSLPQPDLWNAIRDAEQLSPIVPHRMPSNLWRRYDRMARFPAGLIALGDAVCSFNPVFGQGMTTAALDAQALADHLAEEAQAHTGADPLSQRPGFSHRFQRRLVPAKQVAWTLATSEDFRYPAVSGKRPLGLPVFNWYKSLYLECADDPELNRRFLEVLNFQSGMTAILQPRALARVMTRTAARSLRSALGATPRAVYPPMPPMQSAHA